MPFPVGHSLSVVAVAFFAVSIMFAAAAWVYADAKTYVGRGNPIVFSSGAFHLSTPAAWFFACLLLGELFVPVYIDSRGPA
jgi:hypothetical protein